MSRRKILTFLVCFLTLLSFTFLIFATNRVTTKSKLSSYNNYKISKDYLLESNIQFKTLGNSVIFASCDKTKNKTIVGKLDLSSGEITKLKEFNGFLYGNLIVESSDIYVTLPASNNQTQICNLTTGEINTIGTYTNDKDTIVISGNFIYAINCASVDGGRKKVVRYDLNNPGNNYTYELANNAKQIVKTTKGNILVSTQQDTYCLEGNNIKTTIGADFKDGIKTLDNGLVSDFAGNVFNYSNGNFTKVYKSFAGDFNFLTSNETNNFVLINNRIFLLDNNGTALKQYTLNEPANNMILATNKYLASFTINNNQTASIDVFNINNDSEEIAYDDYNKYSGSFKLEPDAGNIAYDDIKNLDKWKVYLDINVVSTKDKGQPKVEITDDNTGEVYLRTIDKNNLYIDPNGWLISFAPADKIDNHSYTVRVLDLNNSLGEPASLTYGINVIDTPQTDKIDSKVYNINRSLNTISNITPGTSVSEFKSNLIYTGNLEIKSMNGNILNSGKIGTGAKLSLYQQGNLKDQLTVVIYGDLNGDSTIGSADVKLAENYLLGKEQLNDFAKMAFDVNHDGTCNSLDLLLIKKNIKGLYKIDQNDK